MPGAAMSDLDARALEAFARYLSNLPSDALELGSAVADGALDPDLRAQLAGALNYLFKSLDLIDDGIEALGYLDDALILRIAVDEAAARGSLPEGLTRLASDAELVREFLGELGDRFQRYVQGLTAVEVRGRSVETILSDAATQEEFLGEVSGWAHRYEAPTFLPEPKNLVKFKAFLATKLPA
jgi:uncharacterized membrane protein YkvA (DUF1232 family)